MKTNQMMEVKINSNLTIKIGHKTRIGKADEIFKHGNWLREQKGLRPYDKLKDILKKRSFWEFVVAIRTLDANSEYKTQADVSKNNKSQGGDSPLWNKEPYSSDFSELDNYYYESRGEMKIKELIKQFPDLIKAQRGGKVENRGYWMDIRLLLKLAAMLDPDLEAQIYHIFIEGKILELRDEGGNLYKKLNKAIDTLSDRANKDNKGCYITVARMIRDKLGIDGSGYNGNNADLSIQDKRKEIEDKLVMLIDMGYVKSFDELKDAIMRLK